MNAKKAKEEAERLHRERLARIEQEVRDEESRQKRDAEDKKAQIDRAEKNRLAPVDDSQMVDEMFGFIDAQTDSSGEGIAPAAFKVGYIRKSATCLSPMHM